jgi:hypothetical protein
MAAPGSHFRTSDTPSPARLRNSGSFQNGGRTSCSGMDIKASSSTLPKRSSSSILAAGRKPAPPCPFLIPAYLCATTGTDPSWSSQASVIVPLAPSPLTSHFRFSTIEDGLLMCIFVLPRSCDPS